VTRPARLEFAAPTSCNPLEAARELATDPRGVHAGPLILRDGDVFGHTVNLASRVAGAAMAGQVVVTSEVVAAASSVAVAFEAMGPTELKGVVEPVELHRVVRVNV